MRLRSAVAPVPVGKVRLYAGRREIALANVLGSTSSAAPILRAISRLTGPRSRSTLRSVSVDLPAFRAK